MSKGHVVIGLSLLLLVMGHVLAAIVLGRFVPVFGRDSVLPNTIAILMNFTLRDYILVFLSAGFFLSGPFMLLMGIVLDLKKK
jgi:hypothetical protein